MKVIHIKQNKPSSFPNRLSQRLIDLSPQKRALLDQRLKQHVVTGHVLVARALSAAGFTHVHTIAGTPIYQTIAACLQSGLKVVALRHQQAAVMAAMAQNYVAGKLTAAVIVSAGPAVTNTVTGMLVARDNAWPVIVIGGRRSLVNEAIGEFQTLDAVPTMSSIAKWAACVPTTDELPQYLQRAFESTMSGRPGPVYLDVPEDVLNATVKLPQESTSSGTATARNTVPSVATAATIEQAASLLLNAQRPAVLFGKGVRWNDAFVPLSALIERYRIPFICSPMGLGFLPDKPPLCCNSAPHVLQSEADVVLLVGARLDWNFRYGYELAPNVKLIHLDIVQQDMGRNVEPTVRLVGDGRTILDALLRQLQRLSADVSHTDFHVTWLKRLATKCETTVVGKQPKINARYMEAVISPYQLMNEIQAVLPPEVVTILDGNMSMLMAQQVLAAPSPLSRLTSGSNGCLGVGVAFAIGAKLAAPQRPVVAICGDLAFGLTAMELETAIRYDLSLVIIVVNNGGNGGRLIQQTYFDDFDSPVATFHPGSRYEKIVHAFGGEGHFIERIEEIQPTLRHALANGGVHLLNVMVDPLTPVFRNQKK